MAHKKLPNYNPLYHDEFQNRFLKLAKEKGYTTYHEIAEEIEKRNLLPFKGKGGENGTVKVESLEKTLQRQFSEHNEQHPKSNPELQAKYLIAYAKLLNCSTDYLIGLTDIRTTNTTIKDICTKTDLSEKALTKLINKTYLQYKKRIVFTSNPFGCIDDTDIINALMSSDEFYEYLRSFQNWVNTYERYFDFNPPKRTVKEILGEELYNKAHNIFLEQSEEDNPYDWSKFDSKTQKALELVDKEYVEEYEQAEQTQDNEMRESATRFLIETSARRLTDEIIEILKAKIHQEAKIIKEKNSKQ